LYRVLNYLGSLKLSTIYKPGIPYNELPYLNFIPIFFGALSELPKSAEFKIDAWKPVVIGKSGPGVLSTTRSEKVGIKCPSSTSALVFQAIVWKMEQFSELFDSFKQVAALTGQDSLVSKLQQVAEWAGKDKRLVHLCPSTLVDNKKTYYLAKLGVKEEPGKVRVFAMVDWWTQMLLRPLHVAIFRILGRIPQDFTMDQDRSVSFGLRRLSRTGFAASYDLSAATDRLPVKLQSRLLNHLIPGLGDAWQRLLVDRDYALPFSLQKIGFRVPNVIRYAVGQPMGALSSWAMLALTHHFVVQFAA